MKLRSFISFVISILYYAYIGVCYAQVDGGEQLRDRSAAQANNPAVSNYLVHTPSSVLKVYVGKAGVLSAMGHNHVITFHEITGQVTTADATQQAGATLQIAMGESIIDDEQERRRAGDGYDSIPGNSAREATRKNMTGPRVLDVSQYPLVEVNINQPGEDQDIDLYEVTLNFKDTEINLMLPAKVSIRENIILVESEFQLTHEQLGLRPFSAAGGLLRVAEEIRFQIHVEAVRN